MTVGDFQEFQERYYKIISQIAVKAVDLGDFKIDGGDVEFFLDTNGNKYEKETDALTGLLEDANKANLDVSEYGFEVKDDLLKKDEDMKIFQYFHSISNGNNIGLDISGLSIPDVNKQEIQAQGFVKAFEEMKSKGNSPEEFQKYYKNVQSLSRQPDLLEVENPELSASLDRANGIFDNFNRAKDKYDTERRQQEVFGDSDSVVSEPPSIRSMLDKAEKAYDLQHDLRIKLAKHIALNNIPVFNENGKVSEKFDDLEVGNIFEGSQITEGIDDYLKKSVSELIRDQSEVTKLNKVFSALGIDGENVGNFRKLVDDEKAKIEVQRQQRESENRSTTSQSVNTPRRSNTKEQKLINLKENLAKKILKVAGVSDKQIDRIMNNPEMKAAMMKRAGKLLKDLKVKEQDVLKFGPGNAMHNVKDQDLQEKIEDQVEELVAQVGRTTVTTIETRDMRGRENLHDKFQSEAVKLDQKAFDKKMGEALKYENKKDKRNMGESFLYNTFYRKPMQLINLLRPDDKPLFKPWQKAMIGVIAFAALAQPLGMIVGLLFLGKALDEKTGMLSWLTEEIFGKGEQREVINDREIEKINVKDLITEVSQDLDRPVSRSQGQQTDIERGQDKQTDKQTRRVVDQTELVTEKTPLQQGVEESVVIDPETRSQVQSSVAKFDAIMKSRPELQENLKVIKTAKDMVGKDGVIDTGALETAQEKIKHNKQQSKGIGK